MAQGTGHYPESVLRPRARLLRTLGEELISSEVVAVIELVKNAYDADATRVLIRFNPPLEPKQGSIEVIDNGHGMSPDVVRTVWMEPATVSKRLKTHSDKFKRRYLGEKGVGRFASARLAEEMEVISRPEHTENEVFAIFDWRQFDNEDLYLDEVQILWEERKPREIRLGGAIETLWANKSRRQPHDLTHGTILRMSSLKQKWEERHFIDLRRGLARLISPVRNKDDVGEFEIELDLPEEYKRYSSKIETPEILKHPHYAIKGRVNVDGSYVLNYRDYDKTVGEKVEGVFMRMNARKGKSEVRSIDLKKVDGGVEAKTLQCGPFEVELRIWDRDELGNVVERTESTLTEVRRDLDSVAGINVYRDFFRVLPYGEPKDDWLRLDLRRVQNPTLRLSNNQIYGLVFISADRNPDLRDQSNREGLDENQALNDLRDAILGILQMVEERRYVARRSETSRPAKTVGGLFAGANFQPLKDYISKHIPEDKQAKELVKQTEEALDNQMKEIQIVLARYQRLATLGQLIDHVLHEGRQPIATINNEADLGAEEIQRIQRSSTIKLDKTVRRFELIRQQGDILSTSFRRMEPFGGRRRGRPSNVVLERVINDAFEVYRSEIDRLKVKVDLPKTETVVRVDTAEIQEVIVNLLQNSLYWLEQAQEGKRRILVEVNRKSSDLLELLFSDSGPGVPVNNRDLIFDPYFSTRVDGVGLGLSIAGEIISDYYGGSLELLQQGPLSGATFLITLKRRI